LLFENDANTVAIYKLIAFKYIHIALIYIPMAERQKNSLQYKTIKLHGISQYKATNTNSTSM